MKKEEEDFRTLKFSGAATYQIVIQGELDERWSNRLGGLEIKVKQKEDGPPVSILTGYFVDQAALSGVLNSLYDMHLPLMAVKILDE